MAAREEEEFELVLGNKQLLSLFFLVVVLFGVFFSFGYTVGFNRGENSETREVASAEPVEEPEQKVQLPEALLQDAPKPAAPSPSKVEPVTTARKDSSSPAQKAPAKETPKPRPVPKAAKAEPPPPAKTSTPAKTTPAKTAPAPTPTKTASAPASPVRPGQQPSAQQVTAGTHLQISAVRVQKDAEVFVEQLRAKGHPTALSDRGDGWFRVVVGPFNSDAEARSYQELLLQQGHKSLLRKR